MSLVELAPIQPPVPAAWDIQRTTFSHDVLGRYACNTWGEIQQQQSAGGYHFDVIVVGAGMFGGYCAENLYRRGGRAGTSRPAPRCWSLPSSEPHPEPSPAPGRHRRRTGHQLEE